MAMPSDVFPSGIAISEDGRRAYISSFIDVNPALLVIDIKTRTILARIPLPYAYPQSVFLTPDDTDLFITFPLSNAVAELDTTTLTISSTLAIPSPYGIAFLPSGTRAYLSSGTTPGKISILDMATNQVVGSYAAGNGPTALEVSRDGRFLAGLTFATNSLFYIDLLTGSIANGSAGSNFATSLLFLQ
jgi:DNA-binding beta-propeller fold protein YncE